MPVIERIFATFGDSDVRTDRVRPEHRRDRATHPRRRRPTTGSCGATRDGALAQSLGLERLPAFVHLRQDTTLVTAAQGWSPTEWQSVADEIARSQHWTSPVVAGRRRPAARPGLADRLLTRRGLPVVRRPLIRVQRTRCASRGSVSVNPPPCPRRRRT